MYTYIFDQYFLNAFSCDINNMHIHNIFNICTIILLLFITGVPAMVPGVTVDVNINGDIVKLKMSWEEPFNNLDPIVNYIVSCSGDVKCPRNLTTTSRSYIITNVLMPGTNYTFSVVATNSIGSGEASVVMITTPPGENVGE